MNNAQLYKGKKFTTWSINRVAEVLCDEWRSLNPTLEKNVIAYEKKVTQISFKGEVNVALNIMKRKHSEKDSVQMYFGVSLSPTPNDLRTHVLNTFDMGVIMDLFPQLENKDCFAIPKTMPWNDSLISEASEGMRNIVETMLKFETCFHLLLDDQYQVDGTKLDSKSLSLTHHLNQVKAYRLAEIYGHPEKLDEAIEAIKRFAETDTLSRQRLDNLRPTKSPGGMDWLYTPEMIEKLHS